MRLKKWLGLCMAAVILGSVYTIPAQAAEIEMGIPAVQNADEEKMLTLENGQRAEATAYGIEARGSIISTAMVSLENLTGGKMGISISTFAHVECERIQNIAYLYKQEDDGSWTELKRYEYNAYKKDFPTEDLSGLTNTVTVSGLETGKYYKVRGIHCVWADGKGQAYSTRTDAILATKYGD